MSKFASIEIDKAIVDRARRGDARAHEIIYRAFSALVYSLCLRCTKVLAHAEDLVQEAFIRLHRSAGSIRSRWNSSASQSRGGRFVSGPIMITASRRPSTTRAAR